MEEYFSMPNNSMILTCPECANGGQLANRIAEELSTEGCGRRLCLADIGVPVSRMSSFIQSAAKDVSFIIAIDGCSRGCAKKELEKAKLPLNNYLVQFRNPRPVGVVMWVGYADPEWVWP